MKIENTLNQKELETLLRFANWAHTTFEWRFGQAIFNGLHIMFPNTAEEIRTSPMDPFYKDTVKADFYALICPDPVRLAPGTTCPMCGLEIEPEEFDMEYTDEDIKQLDEATEKILDLIKSFTKKHK